MNVVVIVTDSLRADYVGCYGGKAKTPNLDRFAKESAVFEQAYTESLPTMPTRTTWWTGKTNFPLRSWQPFEHSDYLLAEMLYSRGYASALISDTYHMHKPSYNCGRGFDTVVWVRGQEYDPWIVDENIKVDLSQYYRLRGDDSDTLWKPHAEQYLRNISPRKTEEDYCVARTVKEAIHWLEQVTKKQKDNLFLWVDCFDPHEPWDPPEPFWSMYDPNYQGLNLIDPIPGQVEGYMTKEELNHTKALYAGEVSFVDKWVGILLDYLRESGLFENSLIMHTTDHGEPLGEHGIIRKAKPWNYSELVHIPWLIYHPEGIGKGGKFENMVQTTDLLPTVLDFLKITPENLTHDATAGKNEIILDGHSLLPMMGGKIDKVRDYVFIGHAFRSWSIRSKEWSYHLFLDKNTPPELYNLKKDWGEQKNVIAENPDIAKKLELELRKGVAELCPT